MDRAFFFFTFTLAFCRFSRGMAWMSMEIAWRGFDAEIARRSRGGYEVLNRSFREDCCEFAIDHYDCFDHHLGVVPLLFMIPLLISTHQAFDAPPVHRSDVLTGLAISITSFRRPLALETPRTVSKQPGGRERVRAQRVAKVAWDRSISLCRSNNTCLGRILRAVCRESSSHSPSPAIKFTILRRTCRPSAFPPNS